MTASTSTVGDRWVPPAAPATAGWADVVLDRARTGSPLCAVVVGTPGSGRSALLAAAHERLRRLDVPVSVGMPSGDVATGASRVVVIADDIHSWPGDLVAAATKMVDAGTVGLIAATEPRDADPGVRELLDRARRMGAAVVLEPMSTAEVLTRASHAGVILEPTVASRIRRRCGGARSVVDDVLREIGAPEAGESPGEPAGEVAIAERLARDWHHRLLRGLEPLTRSVLVLAAVRAPLDPDSIAHVLDIDRDSAVEALDRARGCGLLRGSDVFVSAAAGPLRDVVGDRHVDDLRRRSALARLRGTELSADDALLAAEAGIDDPRLVDALLAGAADATAARAVVLLRAADRVEPGRDDIRLLMAQRALASGDVDGAGRVADHRLETAAPGDAGIEHWVGVAAAVAVHRGLASHAADLYRWLGPAIAAADALSAVVALVAVGDRDTAVAVADEDRRRPPVGSRAARSLVVHGLLAALDASRDGLANTSLDPVDAVVRGLTASVSMWRGPTSGRAVQAAVALAISDGKPVAAQSIRRLAGSGPAGDLLDAEIALATGDLEAAGRLLPQADPAGMADRFRVHAVRLGLARRNGDVPAMTALWSQGLALLAVTEVDLYLLRALSEYWLAAQRLDVMPTILRYVAAADRLLAELGDPALWSPAWHFAGVQVAFGARDAEQLEVRLERLAAAAARSVTASCLLSAARAWARVGGPDRSDPLRADEVAGVVTALEQFGLHWEAERLAGLAALRAEDTSTVADLLAVARSAGENRGPGPHPPGGPLTERESEVAHELLQGYTYREIGERLYISAKTVEHHVARIRRRLDAGSRSELLSALRAVGYR